MLALAALSACVMWSTALLLHKSTGLLSQFGDNAAYLTVANAIRQWDLRGVAIQHFMGYPYFIAFVSLLFHISPTVGLVLVSSSASLLSNG